MMLQQNSLRLKSTVTLDANIPVFSLVLLLSSFDELKFVH